MHMSEFEEGQAPTSKFDGSQPSGQSGEFPDDFSVDDAAFVKELDALFSLDHEELPPLFAQTLMVSEDPRFQAVEHAFEKKTYVRVFRRLHLKRRLFPAPRFSLRALGFPPVPRSFITIVAACFLFMLFTVILTGQAFAEGWVYLWSGPHSGVLQVTVYPSVTPSVQSTPAPANGNRQISIGDAQSLLHFPLYWPRNIPERYTEREMYLYPGDQSWADGPVVVLTFTYVAHDLEPRQIAICEFKPEGKVLQVTQHGAAHRVEIGQDGSSGIYVEGQWTQPGNSTDRPSWVYSERSELIYEHKDDGVVFWIVGDKRDGIDSDALREIALSLRLSEIQPSKTPTVERLEHVTQAVYDMPWPFGDDVIYLDDPDNPSGPSFKVVHAGSHHPSFPRMLY